MLKLFRKNKNIPGFFKSLQWRLILIFILLNIFLILPIGLYLSQSVETQYYKNFKNNIEEGFRQWDIDETNTVEEMLAYLRDQRRVVYEFKIIGTNMSYAVLEKNLILEYSSVSVQSDQELDSFILELTGSKNMISALAGNKGDNGRLVHYSGESYFDYALPVKLADGDYILYFRYNSDDWSALLKNFNAIIIRSILIASIISLILGFFLSRTITKPIKEITQKARRIASGDFDQMLEVKSGDEIGQLTTTFNYMANNLKETLSEVSSEKSKIETILNYMTDGVIAFNLKGKLIHSNPVSRVLLEEDEVTYTYQEFNEKFHTGISLEEVLYLEEFKNREVFIRVDTRHIQIFFAIFADENKNREGILLVLHDVTEQKKLELMRNEFVANVSHELRTPITSVKSYAETLLQEGGLDERETSEKFLRVINSEADRMTRLIKDLLQLSRLDNQQMQWDMKHFSFTELVRFCVERIKIESEAKQQKLECFVIGEIPDIEGDRDRLEQVVVNLLSNAIKYTPENGSISVFVGKNYREVYFKIADNGEGIPAEDMPRIFERFYRVDKGRSREQGGTGLGLSIAKEIVEAHSGTISIKSTVGKGTEIIVNLPVEQPVTIGDAKQTKGKAE